MIEKLNLKGGKIDYEEFNINLDLPLEKQVDLLNEDLLQISYLNDKYVIDVGWYPEFDLKGNFIIYVIESYNWEKPLYKVECKDLKELKVNLQNLINRIDKLQKKLSV